MRCIFLHVFKREESLPAVHQPPRDPPHRPGEEGVQSGGLHAEERSGSGPGHGQQSGFLVRPILSQNLQVSGGKSKHVNEAPDQ